MRLILALVAAVGVFVMVGMLVAPHQPELRAWYLNNACPLLDRLSDDICAAVRREAPGKSAEVPLDRRIGQQHWLTSLARARGCLIDCVEPMLLLD